MPEMLAFRSAGETLYLPCGLQTNKPAQCPRCWRSALLVKRSTCRVVYKLTNLRNARDVGVPLYLPCGLQTNKPAQCPRCWRSALMVKRSTCRVVYKLTNLRNARDVGVPLCW